MLLSQVEVGKIVHLSDIHIFVASKNNFIIVTPNKRISSGRSPVDIIVQESTITDFIDTIKQVYEPSWFIELISDFVINYHSKE